MDQNYQKVKYPVYVKFNMGIEFLENGGMCKMLIGLLKHPNGVQRVYYRTELGLGSRAANRNHKILYEMQLIENIPHPTQLLFGLTKKGKKIAGLLDKIDQINNG